MRALALLTLVLAACSGDDGDKTDTTDTTDTDAPTTDTEDTDVPTTETGTTPGDTGDEDLCAPQAGSSTQVPETQVNTTYPTPGGGAIADGTYDMVRFEVYAPANADGNIRAERLVVANGAVTSISSDNGGPDEILGAMVTENGAMLDFEVVCPIETVISVPYTATPTELWLFDPSEPNLKVYQKQ